MTIKITTGFGDIVTSKSINSKISTIIGDNVVVSGFNVYIENMHNLGISPGKCIILGTAIEEDSEHFRLQIPSFEKYNEFYIFLVYEHEEVSFKAIIKSEQIALDNELLIYKVTCSNENSITISPIDQQVDLGTLSELSDIYRTIVNNLETSQNIEYSGSLISCTDTFSSKTEGMKIMGNSIKKDNKILNVGSNNLLKLISTGKNLSPIKMYTDFSDAGITLNSDGNVINMIGTATVKQDFYLSKENRKFKVNRDSGIVISLKKISGTYDELNLAVTLFNGIETTYIVSPSDKPVVITSDSENAYVKDIRIHANKDVSFNCRFSMQIERGVVSTEYEKYVQDIVEIPIPLAGGLKGLPSGICDEVTQHGEVIQRVGEIILTGNEDWALLDNNGNSIYYIDLDSTSESSNQELICDMLPSYGFNQNDEGVYCDNKRLYIVLDYDKLPDMSVVGFKEWVKSNNIRVLFELGKDGNARVDNLNLHLFGNSTSIFSNSSVNPHLSISSDNSEFIGDGVVEVSGSSSFITDEVSIKGNTQGGLTEDNLIAEAPNLFMFNDFTHVSIDNSVKTDMEFTCNVDGEDVTKNINSGEGISGTSVSVTSNMKIYGNTVGGYDPVTGFSHPLSSVGETYDSSFSKEVSSDEVITGHDGFKGEINNLRITGNTVGGYDPVTGFSRPLSSVGETYDSSFSKEVSSDEVITGHDGFKGEISNLRITGNTVGGYNSETSTSFPLTSVGEAENNRISILSTGKNLFKNEYLRKENNTIISEYSSNKIVWRRDGGVTQGRFWVAKLNAGTYTFSMNIAKYLISSNIRVCTYNFEYGDKKDIHTWFNGGYVFKTFTITENRVFGIETDYISNEFFVFENLQLEEGTTATSYEEYKADKKDILLPSSMSGLNGLTNVQDEVDFNGKIVQKLAYEKFIGSDDENWIINTSNDTIQRFRIVPKVLAKDGRNVVSNHFQANSDTLVSETIHLYKIFGVIVGVENSKLETPDVIGFKKLLQKWNSNGVPLEIVYEIDSYIAHEIPPQKLSTFKPLTTLSCGNYIQPTSMTGKATFSPLVPVAETENGLIMARTCGINIFDYTKTKNLPFDSDTNSYNEIISNGIRIRRYTSGFHPQCLKVNLKAGIYSSKADVKWSDGGSHSMYLYVYTECAKPALVSAPIGRDFTISKDGIYFIGFEKLGTSMGGYADVTNIMINVKSSQATDYEPYQESITQVQLPESMGSLKGVGSVQDEVNFNGNIVQKCDRYTFENNLIFTNFTTFGELCFAEIVIPTLGNGSHSITCDKLPCHIGVDLWENNIRGISKWGNKIQCILNKSDLETYDADVFATYFSKNNVSIIYELTTPIIHDMTPQKLSTFKAVTTLSCDNSVQPTSMTGVATFSHLESVTENENGMITVKTTGRNLFDINKITGYSGGNEYDKSFITVIGNKLIIKNQEINYNIPAYKLFIGKIRDDIYIKQEGQASGLIYFTQYNNGIKIVEQDTVTNFIGRDRIHPNTDMIFIGFGNTKLTDYEIYNIQIGYGAISPIKYEGYKESATQVRLPAAMKNLKGVGYSFRDIIRNNEIEQKVKSYEITGSEDWKFDSSSSNTCRFKLIGGIDKIASANAGICNKFILELNASTDSESIQLFENGDIHIRISKNKASSVYDLKAWLKSNKVAICYALKNPIIHKISGTVETSGNVHKTQSAYAPLESVSSDLKLFSVSKNIFNIKKYIQDNKNTNGLSAFDNGIKLDCSANNKIMSELNNSYFDSIPFQSNSRYLLKYTSSHTGTMNVNFIYIYSDGTTSSADNIPSIEGKEVTSLGFNWNKNADTGSSVLTNVILTKGIYPISYENFKSHTLSVGNSVELKSLPTGIMDEINTSNITTNNVGRLLLTGTEDWVFEKITGNLVKFSLMLNNTTSDRSQVLLSDRFPSFGFDDTRENIYSDNKELFVVIHKSRLSSYDLEGFKTWLSVKNVEVIYEIDKTNSDRVEDINLHTFDGVTNILSDNSVQAKLSGSIPNSSVSGYSNFSDITSYNCKNSIKGITKNLTIKGSTIGGYNASTSTSFPLESVGEKENGMIVAKTTGKNLFDKNSKNIINNSHLKDDGGIAGNNNWCISDYIRVNPNVSYARPNKNILCFYDINKNYIHSSRNSIFVTPTNCFYIRNSVEKISIDRHQIEEGNISTDYEEYKESIVQVQLPSSMNGLNKISNIYDSLLESSVVQKTRRVDFTGDENWTLQGFPASSKVLRFVHMLSGGMGDKDVLCNNFISKPLMNLDDEHVYYSSTSGGNVAIYISKSKLDTPDVVGFKKWLSENPTSVVFALREPITHEIPQSQKLSTFKPLTTTSSEKEVLSDE